MKTMKKVLALVVAMMVIVAMSSVAMAATITLQTPTEEVAPTKDTTYTIYKVFDATVNATDNTKVSYTLCAGDSLSAAMKAAGFAVDPAGNVSFTGSMPSDGSANNTVIQAIAGYVTEADKVGTVTVAAGSTSGTSGDLAPGYYYITTSTGTAVLIDTTNENITIKDKNVLTDVDKVAGTEYDEASKKAIAAVGTSQPFTAKITKRHGATNMVFSDTMTNMTFNGEVTVTVGGTAVAASASTYTVSGAAGDASFTISFANAYTDSLADDTEIILNYSATVTSDALSNSPAENKATVTTGNGNTYKDEPVQVYNAKFTVTKKDGDGAALAGAGFVIKNEAGKYYKLAADKKSIVWYELPEGTELADAIAAGNITEYTSDDKGAVTAFTGLGVGTYTLVESTTPAGYNTAADSTFTIAAGDYNSSNLEQTSTVTNNAGTELPSTGGMGTTILYTVGGILVLGAAILLVVRRRVGAGK